MNEALSDLVDRLRTQQADQIRDRRIVIFTPVLAGGTPRVTLYRDLGAQSQLVVTFGDGTGPLPAPEDADVVRLSYSGPVKSATDELDEWQRVVVDPPAAVLDALRQFDPTGEALVVVAAPVATPERVFGRETIGGRSFADQSLEDKTLCGDIFRAAGVGMAREEVVRAEPNALRESSTRLDRGDGVVISSDASQGLNGGAAKVWWLRPDADSDSLFHEISQAGETARVMPFLEGQPCSIHGFVTDDGALVLRPVELCMLRPADGTGFRQAGISTWWDPLPAARSEMREVARKVGDVLGSVHDYCGAFGIDGILTRDGFRPHEINPRFSAGINTINKAFEDIPLNLLDMAIRSRSGLQFDLAAVEEALVAEADAHRFGSAYLGSSSVQPVETIRVLVTGSPQQALTVTDDEREAIGSLELGPAAVGGLVRFSPLTFTAGERMTPWAVAVYRLADELWGTAFGAMEAPVEFR